MSMFKGQDILPDCSVLLKYDYMQKSKKQLLKCKLLNDVYNTEKKKKKARMLVM